MGEGLRGRKFAAIACVTALMLTACGARLTAQQRAAGIGLVGGNGTGVTGPGGTAVGPGGTTTGPGAVTGPGGISTGGPVASVAPTAPAGGNGGATDTGVTASKITIATIADVSGVQPGLFRSAHQAMQALVAMVNTQGGIDGRLLDLILEDSKVDSGATRAAVLDACNKAFALVGSMSAFDDGGAQAVDQCKIPDITAITTSGARLHANYTYPVYPNGPDWFINGSGAYLKSKYPNAVKHAAQLWLNTSTTRNNALNKRKAYSAMGYDFTYTAETQVVESNYTPYVQKMKDKGVQFVTMLSDWQSIQRLTDAMRNEKWKPQVMEWDSVVYSPQFLEQAQGSADGSFVYLNTALIEEIASNPEMQLYAQWLARVAPGVKPDYFGLYAWSAGRFFVEKLKEIGPKITREKLMDAVRASHSWADFGMHAAHDVGNKKPSPCTMYVQIQNNKFVRYTPAKGFNCGTPLYKES